MCGILSFILLSLFPLLPDTFPWFLWFLSLCPGRGWVDKRDRGQFTGGRGRVGGAAWRDHEESQRWYLPGLRAPQEPLGTEIGFLQPQREEASTQELIEDRARATQARVQEVWEELQPWLISQPAPEGPCGGEAFRVLQVWEKFCVQLQPQRPPEKPLPGETLQVPQV